MTFLGRFGFALWLAAASCGAWAQKLPDWATTVPADTPEAWYAIGQGPDLETARGVALRAVAARLRSAIEGDVRSTVVESNGRVDQRASVEARERVAKTEFSRSEVQASAKNGSSMLVLLKVDRQAFLKDTRTQLGVLARPIDDAEAAVARNASPLEQFVALRRVSTQLDEAFILSQQLSGAGASDEGRQGVTRFGTLRQRLQQIASGLVFELRAKPADADLATALGGFLADQGMRSATTNTPGANVLNIDAQVRQDELFGDKVTRLNVRLTVVDAQGRSVASREHQVSGSSRYDFRGAREAAVNKLLTALRNEGATAALGFR